MVYLPTNLPIKISHSWIGKYTIFPWIPWVSVELWVNPLSWVYSMDNFKPMVWLRELQLVSGMNRTKSTQSRKVDEAPFMHKEYLLTENQSLAHHFLSKTKNNSIFFGSFNWGGGGEEKNDLGRWRFWTMGSTRRDEDAVSALLLRSWESKLAGTHEEAHDAWCFLLCVIFITAGKNGPHNGPELDGPLLGEFFATHSITSFANIVFGAIKRILSIAITVESAIRVESKDIHWSRGCAALASLPIFLWTHLFVEHLWAEPFQILHSSFEDHQMAVCSS